MVTEDLKRSTETPVQETGKCFGSQRSRCRVENLKTCVLEKQVKIPPQCFSTASVEEEKTPVFEKRSFSPSRVANSHLFIKEISFVSCGQANLPAQHTNTTSSGYCCSSSRQQHKRRIPRASSLGTETSSERRNKDANRFLCPTPTTDQATSTGVGCGSSTAGLSERGVGTAEGVPSGSSSASRIAVVRAFATPPSAKPSSESAKEAEAGRDGDSLLMTYSLRGVRIPGCFLTRSSNHSFGSCRRAAKLDGAIAFAHRMKPSHNAGVSQTFFEISRERSVVETKG